MSDIMLAREFVPNTAVSGQCRQPNGQLPLALCSMCPTRLAGSMENGHATPDAFIQTAAARLHLEKLRPSGAMVSTTHGVASGPGVVHEYFQHDDRYW